MSEYLNSEALRLRAERAESQAQRWRATAYVLLVLLVAQTWLVVDTSIALAGFRKASHVLVLQNNHLREAAARSDRTRNICLDNLQVERRAGERKFQGCLTANAGLVDSLREFDRTIKDQQALIRDSVELAKKCDAQSVSWMHADAR